MKEATSCSILCFGRRQQVSLAFSVPALLLLLLMLLSACNVQNVHASPLNDGLAACSRQKSQLSCIVGCIKCAEVYGRKLYDMAACCTECQETQAILVDDGPEDCSVKYFSNMAQYWKDTAQRMR